MYQGMTFLCPKTVFQIEIVLPVYFRRKESVGGREKERWGEDFPFLTNEKI